jgi:3',5'-cyclic AMP phosphodiesterase CpdA
MNDPVNHPKHYTDHPSGVECITITEHMNFCLGNALKYLWRADLKGNATEDLKKAAWYINREIERRQDEDRRNNSEAGVNTTLSGADHVPSGATNRKFKYLYKP